MDSHEANMEYTLPSSASGTTLLIMDRVTTIGMPPIHDTTLPGRLNINVLPMKYNIMSVITLIRLEFPLFFVLEVSGLVRYVGEVQSSLI